MNIGVLSGHNKMTGKCHEQAIQINNDYDINLKLSIVYFYIKLTILYLCFGIDFKILYRYFSFKKSFPDNSAGTTHSLQFFQIRHVADTAAGY